MKPGFLFMMSVSETELFQWLPMMLKTKRRENHPNKIIQLRKENAVIATIELHNVFAVEVRRLEEQREGSRPREAASAPEASQKTQRRPTQISSTKTREVTAPLRIFSMTMIGTIVTKVITDTATAREAKGILLWATAS